MVYPFDLQENSILPTILIVDDQPENIKVFAELLSRKGYVCETMTDGMSALDQVESMMPDLILLDILMPGLSGFEVCLHLKNMPAVAAIPVIFVSAKEDLDSRLQAFEVGGVDYISKPIQPIELIARVNAHVQLYRLKRQSDAFNEQLNEQIAERTQQLNRLNERMATILASVTDAILLLTSDGKISNTNRGFDTMFSYSPDELFDFPLSHLVLESYLDALDTALDHINSGGSHV
ncbi:MAG: response regulator, partial [Aggregatilineales bacterium]